jgi:hypothetical protein
LFNPYKLTQLQAGLYEFITDQQVIYSVYFGDGKSYFHEFPVFAGDVLTFGFDRITSTGRKFRMDLKVRLTIAQLIIHFLTENRDKVLFFVCDSADSRGTARMRIFEHWYREQKISFLEKHNESINTPEVDIHCSIILHTENNMKHYIISSFRNLSSATAEKLKSY